VLKGVDVDMFTPAGNDVRCEHRLEGKRVVICVTRLVPIKNLPMMLDAIAHVRATRPDVVLVLVGEGPQQPMLAARARELRIADAIHFAGYVPQGQTPGWYRSADVFALSSDFDNSPNVVLEAMACGLPIVATDVGGLREYVTPTANGLLTPKGDARAFADALLAFISDPDRARTTGQHNRHDAVTRFSWAVSAARMRDVYTRVIDEFAGRRPRPRQAVAS
jgi:glycosyltransferase involved in cell wall biosynthesis